MDARSILAQLAGDVELGPGDGDEQMTVGAFGRQVWIEIGPMVCTMSAEDAQAWLRWLAVEETVARGPSADDAQALADWLALDEADDALSVWYEDVLGVVTLQATRPCDGSVCVEIYEHGEGPSSEWSGDVGAVLEAVRVALGLAAA